MQSIGRYELSPIPIANLLRMAFYAGDLLDELEDCEATHDDGKSFEGILQAMLVRAGDRIRLRGFERGYAREEEITARPHGRLLIAKSISSGAMPTKRLACEFDEFGADTPHNRVLKACARSLSRCAASPDHQDSLRALVREMRGVGDVGLSRSLLRVLPRSLGTRRYRVVRFIAQLLVDSGQPDERIGDQWARRLVRDEKKMRAVFETFVRRWCAAHKPRGVKVGRSRLEWSHMPQDFVGRLNTDVTVVGSVWTRIIECKYIRSAFTTHQHGMTMFHPEHLRQIYAYLSRMRDIAGAAKTIHGVLLYPALDSDQSNEIKLGEFGVVVRSVSLSAQWRDVTKQLDAVALQPPCSFA